MDSWRMGLNSSLCRWQRALVMTDNGGTSISFDIEKYRLRQPNSVRTTKESPPRAKMWDLNHPHFSHFQNGCWTSAPIPKSFFSFWSYSSSAALHLGHCHIFVITMSELSISPSIYPSCVPASSWGVAEGMVPVSSGRKARHKEHRLPVHHRQHSRDTQTSTNTHKQG